MSESVEPFYAALRSALGGEYVIDREIHGRGMSRVFLAREVALDRRVVIKTLAPDSAATLSAERFRREIMIAASLQQANIVPVLAAGELAGLPYYVMPYVEGENLRALLAARGALSVREAVGILRDVSRALAFAHARGVVHRDIKPDNVLLSGSTAMVTDFGIAKAIEIASSTSDAGTLTQTGTAIGTPMYMSPEQASGDPNIDFRADIYALGVLAFELLTGVPPFTAKSTRAMLAAHIAQAPTDVAQLRRDIPPALGALIMRCLAKDPADRPASVRRILDELESLSGAELESPAPPVDPRRDRKANERNPAFTAIHDGAHLPAGAGGGSARGQGSAPVSPGPAALPLREPSRGGMWPPEVLQQSGLDVLRSHLAGHLPTPPIASLTGLRLTEVGLGMATAAMPASGWWQSGAGVFLAGTIAFLADLPLSAAALTSAPAGTLVTSSHLSVNFVRPATVASRAFIGRGRLIHGTRSLGLSEALVEDGRGRLLGHATSRCVLFHADRRALPPTQPASHSPLGVPDPYLRPVEGDILGQEVWDATPGLEIVRRIAAGTLRPPITLLFDWRGAEVRDGEFTMEMPASPWLCNAFGTIYGGALALLADVSMTLAVGSTMPPGSAYSPLDLTVHFLRPAMPDSDSAHRLVSRGRVTHRGRTIAVTGCEITDSSGKLVAEASGSTLVLPGRPWQRPVNVGDEITQEGSESASPVDAHAAS